MTKRVLVTGGAGFIGSNFASALANRGWLVVICDWLGSGRKWQNLDDVSITDLVHPPDLTRYLSETKNSVDAIIHMGAISSTTESDGDELVTNNIRLSIDLWEYCGRVQIPFIYASSAAVYGDGKHGFTDDWTLSALERLRPLNAYGWSKLVFDRRVALDVKHGKRVPPKWAGLRFFNVFGSREEHKGKMRSVVSQIIPRALNGEQVKLFRSHSPEYADGGQLRDFIHVVDCVEIMLWILGNEVPSGIFNLGTGRARSFLDLANATFAAMNQEPRISYIDTPESIRANYQYFTEADGASLKAMGCDHVFPELESSVAAYVRDWMIRNDNS